MPRAATSRLRGPAGQFVTQPELRPWLKRRWSATAPAAAPFPAGVGNARDYRPTAKPITRAEMEQVRGGKRGRRNADAGERGLVERSGVPRWWAGRMTYGDYAPCSSTLWPCAA